MSKRGRLSRLLPKLFRSDSKTKSGSTTEVKGPSCVIIFLDDSEQIISYKSSWKGQVLFDQVCDLLNLSEKVYFSLRFVDNFGQAHWLDHSKSISSQLKACSPPQPHLYFGVKFYSADPCKLREEITRYLFFLQVKKDILQGRLPVSFEDAAELCAYAVQSEMGDFDPRIHTPGYVSEFSFVPNQTEELEARIAGMHKRCQGASPIMAEQKFLEKVKWLEMYGVDLHPVQDKSNMEYFLGLTPTGIVVYKHRTKIGSHFWPRVTKARHKGKVFTIRVKDKNNDEHMYAFELSTKSACKHLWKCCCEHHTFFSERSERQSIVDSQTRKEPSVHRVPSHRKARRVNSDSRLSTEQMYQDQYTNHSRGHITIMGQPESVRAPRHRSLPELHGRQSPRSIKSAPWESNFDHGLYTSGHDSPAPRWQTGNASAGSDSESGIIHRKRYFPNRKSSDNESDASMSRRRRRDIDSDTGSEMSFTNSDQNRRNFYAQRNLKTRGSHTSHTFTDNKENNSHGSIPSIHSAPAGEVRQRRRRRRSKSQANSKMPPEELRQHIDFGLVETEGMTDEQRKDIPYTRVETKANLFRIKYSPKFRQKIWASRRKSFGDADKASGTGQREGIGANVTRPNSSYTEPTGRDNRSVGHGSGSVYDKDVQNHQEAALNILHSQENKSCNFETKNDYSNGGWKRNDKLKSGFSDGEQNPFNRRQGYDKRYEQNRLSYNEHARKAPYENMWQNYNNYDKQNRSEYSNYNHDSEDRNPNIQWQRHIYSEFKRNENGSDSYSQSAKLSSQISTHTYSFSRSTVTQSSNHENISENSGPHIYNKPDRFTADSRGAPRSKYTELSNASSPRGASTSKYTELSNMGLHRETSTQPRSHEASSQREASITPRYNELPYIGTSSRITPRVSADQYSSSSPRPGPQYHEEHELPHVSYSGQSGSNSDYGGSQNCQAGPTSNTQQHRVRYQNSSHHNQLGDRKQSQVAAYSSRQSSESAAISSYIHSNTNRESMPANQGYTRPQQSCGFRSDLVTQL